MNISGSPGLFFYALLEDDTEIYAQTLSVGSTGRPDVRVHPRCVPVFGGVLFHLKGSPTTLRLPITLLSA